MGLLMMLHPAHRHMVLLMDDVLALGSWGHLTTYLLMGMLRGLLMGHALWRVKVIWMWLLLIIKILHLRLNLFIVG